MLASVEAYLRCCSYLHTPAPYRLRRMTSSNSREDCELLPPNGKRPWEVSGNASAPYEAG